MRGRGRSLVGRIAVAISVRQRRRRGAQPDVQRRAQPVSTAVTVVGGIRDADRVDHALDRCQSVPIAHCKANTKAEAKSDAHSNTDFDTNTDTDTDTDAHTHANADGDPDADPHPTPNTGPAASGLKASRSTIYTGDTKYCPGQPRDVRIVVSATDPDGISSVVLFFHPPNAAGFVQRNMQRSGSQWFATVNTGSDRIAGGGKLAYYVMATDANAVPKKTRFRRRAPPG